MRTRKTIITLTTTTLFLALSLVGTGYATQSPQETTIETTNTYTIDTEILVKSETEKSDSTWEIIYDGDDGLGEKFDPVWDIVSGDSKAEFDCYRYQRFIQAVAFEYLSEHPELNPRDLMGVVDHNHPLVVNKVILETCKCPNTYTYYRITSDGTIEACSSHGYLIGNYFGVNLSPF